MSPKDDFIRQLETQIAEWEKQIAGYQTMVEESTGQLRATHEKNLQTLRTALTRAETIREQVSKANESAWNGMQAATQAAIQRLSKGWLDALSSDRPDK